MAESYNGKPILDQIETIKTAEEKASTARVDLSKQLAQRKIERSIIRDRTYKDAVVLGI
jgi:hypothetical protein